MIAGIGDHGKTLSDREIGFPPFRIEAMSILRAHISIGDVSKFSGEPQTWGRDMLHHSFIYLTLSNIN